MAPGGAAALFDRCLGPVPTLPGGSVFWAQCLFAVLPRPCRLGPVGQKSGSDDRGSWWRCPLVIGARVPKKGAIGAGQSPQMVTSEGHGDDGLLGPPSWDPRTPLGL